MSENLQRLFPAQAFSEQTRETTFNYILRKLATYRNRAEIYASAEEDTDHADFKIVLNQWAQDLLQHAWVVCDCPGGEKDACPELDPYADTSVGDLSETLPSPEDLSRVLNTILFLQITSSKEYSSRTRTFLQSLGTLDEDVIVSTLKNPDRVLDEAKRHAETAETTKHHADKGKILRTAAMGLGAVAGGVLVGVTGGLAAPLVGAAFATIFGWIGIGGTVAGLLASGLAGSSVVCGALFGAYGAKSSAAMVERHTREIRDLSIVPVPRSKLEKRQSDEDSLAVQLCVSGWLSTKEDVVAPWTVCGGSDTFALQWEVKALEELSDALYSMIKSNTMKYIRAEIIRRTVLSSLMSSLAPLAWLKIGQIMDNPWMNTKALAVKAGAVLGDLIAKRVFGTRPLTLSGYSLGSLVIFEALRYLAAQVPASHTLGLIQDVFLFGTPVSTNKKAWASVRRVVAGRLVNGYSTDDYVLAVLSRASDLNWQVAGLGPVDEVMGVENVLCEHVDGHTAWRGMIGKSLQQVGAPGIIAEQVEVQMNTVAKPMQKEMEMTQEEADEVLRKGRSNEF